MTLKISNDSDDHASFSGDASIATAFKNQAHDLKIFELTADPQFWGDGVIQPSSIIKAQSKKLTYLRRARGYVKKVGGPESVIVLIEGNKPEEYYVPSRMLKDAGLRVENQPFEFNQFSDSMGSITIRLNPLAKAGDVRPRSLPLSDESQNKLDYILSRLQG